MPYLYEILENNDKGAGSLKELQSPDEVKDIQYTSDPDWGKKRKEEIKKELKEGYGIDIDDELYDEDDIFS